MLEKGKVNTDAVAAAEAAEVMGAIPMSVGMPGITAINVRLQPLALMARGIPVTFMIPLCREGIKRERRMVGEGRTLTGGIPESVTSTRTTSL